MAYQINTMPRSLVPLFGYLTAGGLFTFSNSLCTIALPWLVYDMTGSAIMMGGIAFVMLVPAITGSLFGGVLADRFDIRNIALLSTAFNLAPMALIAWLASAGSLSISVLVALVFLASVLDGPGQIAFEARWPEVARLARMSLFRANAMDDMIDNLVMIAGPVIAGIILHTMGTAALLWVITCVSALGFLITAATFPKFRNMNIPMSWQKVVDGVWFLARTSDLRAPLLLGAVAIAIWIALEAVIIPAALRDDGQSAKDFSAYLAATGLGAILINLILVVKNITPPIRYLYVIAFIGFALSLFALSIDRSIWTLALSGLASGLAVGPLTPAFNTVLLTLTPKSLRARVSGIAGSLILSLSPFGALIAGVGIENWGARNALLTCGALLLICALRSWFLTDCLPTSDKS